MTIFQHCKGVHSHAALFKSDMRVTKCPFGKISEEQRLPLKGTKCSSPGVMGSQQLKEEEFEY